MRVDKVVPTDFLAACEHKRAQNTFKRAQEHKVVNVQLQLSILGRVTSTICFKQYFVTNNVPSNNKTVHKTFLLLSTFCQPEQRFEFQRGVEVGRSKFHCADRKRELEPATFHCIVHVVQK